ncbi:MAG: glucosamine-6-phosphate deaminase [Cyclobacteriaceae bacterium]
MHTHVFSTREKMGQAAGSAVEERINALLNEQDELRMIFAAAPSQNEVLDYLAQSKQIDWSKITAFHMDEYIGLPADAPQRFATFLKERLFDRVTLRAVHLIVGDDNPEQECQRYADLLAEKPIDIVCLGIGENGHIAFNDPPVADFEDPQLVKVVELDARCRQQQVNDGCFTSLGTVPTQAITLTIPTLMSGNYLYCVVPGPTKREAVDNTLNGPISTDCPASILRTHQNCQLYLDAESARTDHQEGFLES